MAQISDLVVAVSVGDADEFILRQEGEDKRVTKANLVVGVQLQKLSGLTEPSRLDETHRTEATLSRLSLGNYALGSKLIFSELSDSKFDIVSTGVINGLSIRDAGNGNFAKMDLSPKRITLSAFGAIPESVADQTDLIQNILELCAENKVTVVVDGTYWVGSRNRLMDDGVLTRPCCIYVPSNSRIEFLPSAKIKQIANALPTTYVLNFYLRSNIKIWSPEVWGDKDEHTGTTGAFGHCYNVTNCTDVNLINPKASNAWGDGFYVGLEHQGLTSQHLDGVYITGAAYDNISRNGVSFTSGKNVNIEVVKGGTVDRALPKAGMDIEPEINASSPIKPTFENCHVWLSTSNSLTGLLVFLNTLILTNKVDITIHSLHSENDHTPLQLEKVGVSTIKGVIKLDSMVSKTSGSTPIFVKWSNDSINFICDNAFVTDSNFNGPVADPQDSTVFIENISGVACGGFYFNNIVRGSNPNTPLSYRNKAGTLNNSLMNFTDFSLAQLTTSSTGRITSTSNVIGKCTATASVLNSSGLGYDKVSMFPSTGDGITVTLSNNVGFSQTYTKANSTANKIKFVPDAGVTLFYNNAAIASAESVTLGARCEILDIGSSSKVLIPMSGAWTTL